MKYTLDATNKKLGRIATEIATILRGKNSPDFTPNKQSGHVVEVVNASKLDLTDKMDDTYKTFSGYPGGLKIETRGNLLKRRGISEILMRTVRGMLPRNKLRDDMLKNLKVSEYEVTVKVTGGGSHSQAEAVRHGIARALIKIDEEFKSDLKKAGFLKRDPRAKERRKFGLKKARKSAQWSKR